VTTSAALTVGSTDVMMEFDPSVLQALGASSTTLTGFTFFIDNTAGTVTTASAAFPSDVLGAGDELFTVEFVAGALALPGTTTGVTLSDADGEACDDLAGPVPPIPPVSLPYDVGPGQETIAALGDIDCNGSLTPVDASVVLGLFVGSIVDGDLPPPCDDPDNRLAVSDWDLAGTISPIDASVALAIFVGGIDECDAPLGQAIPGLCPAPLAASSTQSSELNEGGSSTVLEVSQTLSVSVDTPDPIVPGQTGVVVTIVADEALTVSSTDITLNWDVAGIQVDSAFSSVLSSFVANIDNANRTMATASASSGSDNIPAGTTLMTFILTANEPGVYNLFITDGDGSAPDDLAGLVPPIPPVSIPYTAVGASLNVVPEPGLLLQLASGVLGLAVLERRRRSANR
jgi:hypothetical protein